MGIKACCFSAIAKQVVMKQLHKAPERCSGLHISARLPEIAMECRPSTVRYLLHHWQ